MPGPTCALSPATRSATRCPEAPGYLFFDICSCATPSTAIRSIYTYFPPQTETPPSMSDLANRATLGDFIAA